MTGTDYFSKWPEATALPNKCAEGVAHFLYSLITRFGCFEVCLSDQGREFVNSITEQLFQMTGVKHRIASAYHPQTNGLDERTNQTVSRSLVKYLNVDKDDWDEHVDAVLFSYRTSIHASTKFTPFYLMYGREAVLPVEVRKDLAETSAELAPVEATEEQIQARVDSLQKIKKAVIPAAETNIKLAQARQKENYDKRHATEEYKVGDLVMVRNSRDDGRKVKFKLPWSPVYEVAEVLEKGVYRLKGRETGEPLIQKINGARLKRYHPREQLQSGQGQGVCPLCRFLIYG